MASVTGAGQGKSGSAAVRGMTPGGTVAQRRLWARFRRVGRSTWVGSNMRKDLGDLSLRHGFDQEIQYCRVGLRSLDFLWANGGRNNEDLDRLAQPGLQLRVFVEEFPAVHHGHAEIDKNDIGQGVGVVTDIFEAVDGQLTVVKFPDLAYAVDRTDDLLCQVDKYRVIVYEKDGLHGACRL